MPSPRPERIPQVRCDDPSASLRSAPVSLRLGHAAALTILLRYPKNAAGLRLSLRFSTAAPPAPRSSRHRRRSAWAPPARRQEPAFESLQTELIQRKPRPDGRGFLCVSARKRTPKHRKTEQKTSKNNKEIPSL